MVVSAIGSGYTNYSTSAVKRNALSTSATPSFGKSPQAVIKAAKGPLAKIRTHLRIVRAVKKNPEVIKAKNAYYDLHHSRPGILSFNRAQHMMKEQKAYLEYCFAIEKAHIETYMQVYA